MTPSPFFSPASTYSSDPIQEVHRLNHELDFLQRENRKLSTIVENKRKSIALLESQISDCNNLIDDQKELIDHQLSRIQTLESKIHLLESEKKEA